MYGAILGDIMSLYHKSENDGIFYLVDKEFKFSDYTVMAIAIADALLPINADEELYESQIKTGVMKSLAVWGKKYQDVEYSRHFKTWISKLFPLKVSDNSAAAAISVIPYIYNDSNLVVETAKMVAAVTHSDIQSINNAGIAALAIYYAKMCPRAIFKNNLEAELTCDFDNPEDLNNIVLEAIKAFLDSTDLENAIENAIARGGDIRTRAVITGSIAEAFYGISGANKSWCNSNLTEEMLAVLDKFDQSARRVFLKATEGGINMSDNEKIEAAISRFHDEDTEDNFDRLMDLIYHGMYEGAELFVPLIIKDKKKAHAEHKVSEDNGEYLRLQAFDGKFFFAAFTSMTDELDEEFPDTYLTNIRDFLEEFEDEADEEEGIILNPGDEEKQFALTKPLIKMLLEEKPPENGMWYFRGNIDKLKSRLEAIATPDYGDFEQSAFEDEDKLAAAHFMTKAENEDQYIIHTPLLSYHGTNEDIIFNCYWYCLELARKYHIHSIAFPVQFSTARSMQTSEGVNSVYVDLYVTLYSWFKENNTYGMKVFAVVNDDETNSEGQYMKANFVDSGNENEDKKNESENKVLILIDDVAALSTEAIVNFTDERLIGIDSKIEEEIHSLAGSELRATLRKINHCNMGEAIATKGYGTHTKYIIHTAIDDNMSNLKTCYRNCLELAKENHLHNIAIPITCSERSNIPRRLNILKSVFLTANDVIGKWFKDNKDYDLTVTLVVEYEDQRFFKIGEIIVEDKVDTKSKEKINLEVNKEKSEAYKKLVLDMQRKYPVSAGNFPKDIGKKADPDAKKIMQEFVATFQSKQDFYDTLKKMGFEWMEVNDERIYDMRAKEVLRIAIENGFDPFDVVTNKGTPVKLFSPVVNGENICHEINLYTYWQGLGYAEKTPKIKYLLVAQDWGNCFEDVGPTKLTIERIKRINSGEDISYIDKDKTTCPTEICMTDKNLIELFKILGYDDIFTRHDELFFTNFCIGYRSGNAVGGMTKELMLKDAEEFKRLCEILEPDNILCLGRLTSECAYEALTGKSFDNIYSSVKNYNDFINNHTDITVKCGEKVARFYPLAHCGYMGSMTRRKGMPKQSDPLYYQKQDWERIAQDNGISSQNIVSENKADKEKSIYLTLSPEIINKEFFKDMMYLHVGPEFGPFFEGYIALLNAKGEFYTGNFLDVVSPLGGGVHNGLFRKIEESFMNFRTEMPNDKKRSKNGWTYFYLGYRHVLYVNNKVVDLFCKKMNIDVERDLKISEKWEDAAMETIAEYENIEDKKIEDKGKGSLISPERMDRFTWKPEDLKFLKSKEMVEEALKTKIKIKNNHTIPDSIRRFTEPPAFFQPFINKHSKMKTALYGALLGDMIGAPYEFDRGNKVKDFPLFSKESRFTDDSVMTIAVTEALLKSGNDVDEKKITSKVIKSMQKWGKKYPHAGYGGRFRDWLKEDNPQPYNSWGNGSAMRVSAVGWICDTVEDTRTIARWTAEISHNHPEGIKGAEATASAIFLARTGKTKEEIKNYIINEFNYDLSRTLDEIRPDYRHDESCQRTVPEAITAFLESTDFEDAIRNAVSLGGDTDTLACITGSIAEAFYNVPEELVIECRKRLPKEILLVIDKFESAIFDYEFEDNSSYDESLDNERLEYAINKYHINKTSENHQKVLRAIYYQLQDKGGFLDPLIKKMNDNDEIEWHVKTIKADDKDFDVVFTNYYEYLKGDNTSLAISETSEKFRVIVEYGDDGIAINPYGKTFLLTAEEIKNIVNAEKPRNNIKIFKGDITKLISVDAIVNPTNTNLSGKYGVDKAIHEAAGYKLGETCQKLHGCKIGEAKITKGYKLPADYVIHTVGANYNGNPNANGELYQCYWNSLELAKEYHLHIIAFPAISTGIKGFPKNEAANIAIKAIHNWFGKNVDYGMTVVMVYINSDDVEMFKMALNQSSFSKVSKEPNQVILSNSKLTKKFCANIAYVKTAASGAMGNPGEIVLLDFAGNLYHGNWAYGDVDIDKLMKVFPAFKEINDGKEVEGWKYYYLGCGNGLMVNDKFRSAFEHQMGIDTGNSVENRYWLDAALETLANSTNNDYYYDDTIKF